MQSAVYSNLQAAFHIELAETPMNYWQLVVHEFIFYAKNDALAVFF